MWTSLRFRMLAAMVSVAGVSLLLAGWLFRDVATQEFDRLVRVEGEVVAQPTEAAAAQLEQHHRGAGSWRGVEPVLVALARERKSQAVLFDSREIFVAAAPEFPPGAEVAWSPDHGIHVRAGGLERMELRVDRPARTTLHDSAGAVVGTLVLLPALPEERQAAQIPAGEFRGAVSRQLVAVIAGVLLLAIVATLLLSRSILRPVASLTAAVTGLKQGDRARRVEVRGAGEIAELGRAFNSMADSLARGEQLRREMVSDVAHELRTPLANLRCQIEAVQDGLAQPSLETLASLHEEVRHLGRIVDDLRDLSLADAGQLSIEREPLDARRLLESAAAGCKARFEAAGVKLEMAATEGLSVTADPARLGQVLRNLLENALAYTPRGGCVQLSAQAHAGGATLSVRDTGAGISREHLPHVFERFYRPDASRTRATGGAGLGLAIVKQLVEAHGGTVRAENAADGGAVFTVNLPA